MKEFLGRKQLGSGCSLGSCWPLPASLVHYGCSYRCFLYQVRTYVHTCTCGYQTLTALAISVLCTYQVHEYNDDMCKGSAER